MGGKIKERFLIPPKKANFINSEVNSNRTGGLGREFLRMDVAGKISNNIENGIVLLRPGFCGVTVL